MRYELFVESVNLIVEHNTRHDKGEVSYNLGINQFADLRPDERPGGRVMSV